MVTTLQEKCAFNIEEHNQAKVDELDAEFVTIKAAEEHKSMF
jgi:hypothetical protein